MPKAKPSGTSSQFSEGGLRKHERRCIAMHVKGEVLGLIITLLGVSPVIAPESSPHHGDEFGMHLRCALCRSYPKAGPTDQHCIERCQKGECKHIHVVYPPD